MHRRAPYNKDRLAQNVSSVEAEKPRYMDIQTRWPIQSPLTHLHPGEKKGNSGQFTGTLESLWVQNIVMHVAGGQYGPKIGFLP